MNKIVLVIGLCLTFFCSLLHAKQKLIMLTWEDYIDPDIVSEFERQNNVDVEFVYFEHDEERDDLVSASNASNYDLFIVDGQSLPTYIRVGWISPLTFKEVPNFVNYNDVWKGIRPESDGYALPYGWGTMGIVYRSDLIDVPLDSLMQLFDPAHNLHGKIIMSPQVLELIPTALMALGYDMNSSDRIELQEAGELLQKQKPYVHSYHALELNENSPLVSGEVFAAQAYNGDASMLAGFNENIKYTVPKEGSPMWIDFISVSAASLNKPLAYRFINYLSEVDVASKNIEYIYTASFIDKAVEQLPDEIRNDPFIFHPQTDKLTIYSEPAPRTMRRMTNMMQNLRINKAN